MLLSYFCMLSEERIERDALIESSPFFFFFFFFFSLKASTAHSPLLYRQMFCVPTTSLV